MEGKTRELQLSLVVPDENQPRKLFEPSKLKNLKDSVKKFGIMTPITVEEIGDKFLLVDGERRYRVAKELGLKTIPATIIRPQNETDRLVQQFHIQEQHEGWTASEKAITVYRLAKELGITIETICEMLAISNTQARRYISFANIVDKENYHKNDIGIEWASYINSLRETAKKLTINKLEEDFSKKDERQLERSVIDRIKSGDLPRVSHMSKLKDIFTKNPRLIKKFLETDTSVSSLFIEAKAKGAYLLRNLMNNVGYAASNAGSFMTIKDVKPTKQQLDVIKNAIKKLQEVTNYFEDIVEKE